MVRKLLPTDVKKRITTHQTKENGNRYSMYTAVSIKQTAKQDKIRALVAAERLEEKKKKKGKRTPVTHAQM